MPKYSVGQEVYTVDDYKIMIEVFKIDKVIISSKGTEYADKRQNTLPEDRLYSVTEAEKVLYDIVNKRHKGELATVKSQVEKAKEHFYSKEVYS